MKIIHLGDENVSVQGSPWALFLYNREFSTDESRADWHEDFQAAYKDFVEDGARVDPLFLLKTCWAMASNYDDTTPDFEDWLRPLDIGIGMNEPWIWEVHDAIFAELFRVEANSGQSEAKPSRKRKQ